MLQAWPKSRILVGFLTMPVRILFIGEIVGKAGIYCIKKALPILKDQHKIDFVIANGEGATGGFGLGKNHSIQIHKLGVDVITTGEKAYYKKDMVLHIQKSPYLLRPVNFPYENPGRGWRTYTAGGMKLAVVSILGQSGFQRVHLTNPHTLLPEITAKLRQDHDAIIVDFHASTTAEKYNLFYRMDGEASVIFGSHTKAITADQKILPKGTAVIADTGRTGSLYGIGGLDPKIEISKFLSQVPERSLECWEQLELQGAVAEIADDGKATDIFAVRFPVAPRETLEKEDDE
jgi:2',3'-cyclic-nucleotide 2'-phosphodiesterase